MNRSLVILVAATLVACAPREMPPVAAVIPMPRAEVGGGTSALAEAIGDRRIVLLGENGHGVGDFTAAKVEMVEWLYREMGFDVVVFESGFFECGQAWRRAAERSPRELLYDCLRYPFEHAEALPIFELIASTRAGDRPLVLAGMDPQSQGFDSGDRPRVLHAVLEGRDAELAARVAALDSALFLVPDSGGLGDRLDPWILEHGPAARAAYDSAAALTEGWERWAFRLAGGLVDRLMAGARSSDPPASYYQLRDEWMGRAVAALADSVAGRRKVVVWLHNDHARYGSFPAGDHEIRPVGSYLREWYGDDVFSVGFFMGQGSIANNGRRVRDVEPLIPGSLESALAERLGEAGYVVFAADPTDPMTGWAHQPMPYLRMGLTPMEMVPAEEFDAIVWIDSVAPPTYRIP